MSLLTDQKVFDHLEEMARQGWDYSGERGIAESLGLSKDQVRSSLTALLSRGLVDVTKVDGIWFSRSAITPPARAWDR